MNLEIAEKDYFKKYENYPSFKEYHIRILKHIINEINSLIIYQCMWLITVEEIMYVNERINIKIDVDIAEKSLFHY